MSEYLPLAKLIEQGLQEGTGLELRGEVDILYKWSKGEVLLFTGNPVSGWNPLAMEFKWRIVSTPPKKITFEANVEDGYVILYVRPAFKDGDKVKITVEGVE